MLNEVKFIGNLTKDIVLRQTSSGTPVTNLDIALNYYVNNEKKTEYVQVVVWDKQAEDAAQYLHKGRQVYVEAKVVIRKREIDGKNIPIPEFHADRVLYLGSSNNQNNGSNQQQGNNNQHNPQQRFQQDQSYHGHNPFTSNGGGNGFNNQEQNYGNNPFGR